MPATSLPFAASPIPASPRLRGLNNCSWWGGKCSLCSFSVPLGVLPTLTTLAISCCLRLSDVCAHTRKHKRTYEHASAPQHLNPLHSLLPLIFLCGALCSRCDWACGGEQEEQRAGKKDGENRTEVVVEEVEKGGDEWERERRNTLHWARCLLLLADQSSLSVCAP